MTTDLSLTPHDISFRNVTKKFGPTTALDAVDLDIPDGSLTVIVGPSGCGKSTLLRVLSGLDSVTDGSLIMAGKDVGRGGENRDLAMVFQDYALYPHMSVARNIGFGLKMSAKHGAIPKIDAKQIQARVEEVAGTLGLTELLGRRPQQLSGGQRQRAALARAIIRRPSVLLLDEPLSALDAQLRSEARSLISSLHRDLGSTMVMVTHDQHEALSMATHMVVMKDGQVIQAGPPEEIYHRPANHFVASFVGNPMMNMHPNGESAGTVGWRANTYRELEPGNAAPDYAGLVLEGEVVHSEFFGASRSLRCRRSGPADAATEFTLIRQDDDRRYRIGDSITIAVPEHQLHFFDANGRRAQA